MSHAHIYCAQNSPELLYNTVCNVVLATEAPVGVLKITERVRVSLVVDCRSSVDENCCGGSG